MSDVTATIPDVDPPIADHTDAYLALAGALGGTLITALFAYFQQRRQRQSEELRLDKQLAHDRALEDRAHLRSIIEDAAGRFEIAIRASVTLGAIVVLGGTDEERHDAPREASTAVDQCRIMTRLLDLRVEFTAPMRMAYIEVVDALNFGLTTLSGDSLDAAELQALREHRRAAAQAFRDFTRQAQRLAGVQFAPD
jgi:hypothetical protein